MTLKLFKYALPTCILLAHPFKFSSRFICTDSSLDKLVDPLLKFTENECFTVQQEEKKLKESSFSVRELGFLQDSILVSSKTEKNGKFPDDAFLLIDVIRESNDGFGEKTEKEVRFFREKLNPGLVVNVLSNIGNSELGVKFFKWAGRQIGYVHNASARNWLNEMIQNRCSPNVVTYAAIIHAYLKQRKISDANELFESMLTQGCIRNVITFTALTDAYCKAGHIEKACQIYARMKGSSDTSEVDLHFKVDLDGNKEPNVVTFGAMVDGLCKAHKVREAHNLLDVMLTEGCEPNHIVYDALIDGFSKVGKLDDAQEIFAKMSERGYSPSIYTYSSLIDRLFKDKRFDLAVKVLSKMLERSCPPNVVIYTEMVDGLCKVGKIDEASKLMLMMEEKGCHPKVVTYTAMIDGFGKAGKVKSCLELIEKMGNKGCAPNCITYSVAIKHCCAAGLLDEALQLLEEMKQTSWPKHMAGHLKVIEGFRREYLISLGILEDMSNNNFLPIIPVYRLLIDSYQKAGRLE
ncbi:hypothetical protein P3S67_024264 [Capsicum chacoense]